MGPAGPVVSAQTGGPGPCAAQTVLYHRGPSPAQGKTRNQSFGNLVFFVCTCFVSMVGVKFGFERVIQIQGETKK